VKKYLWLMACVGALALTQPAVAGVVSNCTTPGSGISCTGSLDTPEDVFLETFSLASTSSVTVQTYRFGGGTNAAGTTIAPGGFDPLVALFSGTANQRHGAA
jgi:hypothetical protein